MIRFICLFCLSAIFLPLYSQVIPISPLDPGGQLIERLRIKSGNTSLHSAHKYYTRESIMQLLSECSNEAEVSTYDLQFLLDDLDESPELHAKYHLFIDYSTDTVISTDPKDPFKSYEQIDATPKIRPHFNERPLLGFLYKQPASMISVDVPQFYLRVDPLIHFRYGRAGNKNIFTNIRGVDLRGGISEKVFFQGSIEESQEAYPDYIDEYINNHQGVPGVGYYKSYASSVVNLKGYDFLNAQGLIGFHILKPITLQFGHGRNFIGDGIRSLFLSDFGANYLYLKLNTKVWIFDYQNLWCQLQYSGRQGADQEIPKKYMAAHHLSLNILPWLNIGLFESVVFSRNNHFELQYLNPIIFYRAVEQLIGSPDNANVGIDFRVRPGKSVNIYGQWIIDELILKNLIKNNGWWGNKNGFQLGFKYMDVAGIDHLDLQAELNRVRPYTYTHSTLNANYTHYNQPLAHPLEANFTEVLAQIKWMPIKNLFVEPRIMYALKGQDKDSIDYGGNIFIPNTNHFQDYNNQQLQGVRTVRMHLGIDISYMWYHNMFVDFSFLRRNFQRAGTSSQNEHIYSIGLRINMAKKYQDF